MVAALRPMGEVALLPREFPHTEIGLEQMACAIIALGEDTRVVMEATGRSEICVRMWLSTHRTPPKQICKLIAAKLGADVDILFPELCNA